MLVKSTAILLKKVTYGERNLILQTYTREEGAQSFFLTSSKSKTKPKINLHALAHLEIVSSKGKGNLPHIREVRLKDKHYNLISDVNRAMIVMFLNEVLMKSVKEHQQDVDLYDFISNSLSLLDHQEKVTVNFHIKFLLDLSWHLGFYPNGQFEETNPYFDLYEGVFVPEQPIHQAAIDPKHSRLFTQLMNVPITSSSEVKLTLAERRVLLSNLIDYFKIHIEKFGELKSKEILETILA